MMELLDLNIKQILSDWKISDAIRELIANAIDEHLITNQTDPIKVDYNEQTKTLVIQDNGRGIKNIHFIQNESNEKKGAFNTIGKFGIGLKDAIAVLVSHDIKVTFISDYGIYTPVMTRKEGIKEDISTIHMQRENNLHEQKGTIITITPVSIEEVNDAKSKFAMFKQWQKVVKTAKGNIMISDDNVAGEIFVNGMKISDDENLIFSYNILETNAALRKALNRERKNLSRDAYRDAIIRILKAIPNNEDKLLVYTKILNNTSSNSNEWSFTDIKSLVITYFNSLDKDKYIIVSPSNDDERFKEYAGNENKVIITVTDKEYASLQSKGIQTIKQFGNDYVSNYEVIYIPENDLTPQELKNWLELKQFVKELAMHWSVLKQSLDSYKFMEVPLRIIKDHPNARGIWRGEDEEIHIVRKMLENKTELFAVTLHEICHMVSGADDATIDFEHALTACLGELANWLWTPNK